MAKRSPVYDASFNGIHDYALHGLFAEREIHFLFMTCGSMSLYGQNWQKWRGTWQAFGTGYLVSRMLPHIDIGKIRYLTLSI